MLKMKLSQQKISVEDVERMARERQGGEETLFALGKRAKELQRDMYDKETDTGRKLQEVSYPSPLPLMI